MTDDTPPPALEPLGSGYLLGEPLGSGAMGQVFRGTTRAGEPVAVKVLRPELSADPAVVGRFLQEAQLLQRLVDPKLVRVRDLVAEGTRLAIVMDLVEGPDLRTELTRRGTFRPIEAAEIVDGVLAGLAAVHAGGVVHRDVKPENVLLEQGRPGGVRLTDLGIARIVEESQKSRRTTVIGTPEYLAPEVADGAPPSAASDLYAVGILLYELVSGVTPFAGGSPLAVLRRHAEWLPVRPDGVPDAIWAVVEQLLAKDPAARPQDATLVRRWLESGAPSFAALPALAPLTEPPAAAVQEQPTIVRTRPETAELPAAAGATAVPAPRRRRRGLVVALAALVALLLVGGGVTAFALTRGSTPAPTPPAQAAAATSSSTAGGLVVPSVVGQQLEQAQATLQAAGLQVQVTQQETDSAPDGSVTGQDPAANESVAPGSTVTLTVAKNSTGVFLSTLQPVANSGDYQSQVQATAISGHPYARAITAVTRCSTPTAVQYNMSRAYQRLTGVVGLTDDSDSRSLVQFDILVDGKPKFSQQVHLGQAVAVDVPVPDGLRLDLEVTRVEKNCSDYDSSSTQTTAAWANMQLVGATPAGPNG